jgi:hypothetical protein
MSDGGRRGDGRSRQVGGGERIPVSTTAQASEPSGPPATAGWRRVEALLALGGLAALCVLALSFATDFLEPDDYALSGFDPGDDPGAFPDPVDRAVPRAGSPGRRPVASRSAHQGRRPRERASGHPAVDAADRWQVDQPEGPGPFLAAPFQALGIIRLAPLF